MNIKNHKGRGLKVRNLHIESFKCFDDIDIDFDERLTVFIGKNGSGKTTILEALELLFANIIDIQLSKASKRKIYEPTQFPVNTISEEDISIDPVSDEFIIDYGIEILFDQEQQRSDRRILFNFNELINGKYNIKFFNDISHSYSGKLYFNIDINHNLQSFINDICLDFNILCYYRSNRSFPKTIEQVDLSKHNIFDAIRNSNIDYSASLAWFADADANEADKRRKEGFKNYIDPSLNIVRETITKSLNNDSNSYEYPHMDNFREELFIKSKKDGLSYKVKDISDGCKTILAIVMDLSRRMAMANENFHFQNKKNILKTPAIVLIDEIEKHLHPSWQQTILPTLLNIFTNTQFIVTTQSPQILTSVKPNNIRIIDNNTINKPEKFSYGAESGYVLENIMKTSSRPPNEVSKYLEEYLKLVNNDEGDSPEAEKIRTELDKYIYDDPILASIDFLIFKNRYIKSQKEQ